MIHTAGIIAVGDEVLNGETVNTNAAWLARELNALGIRLACHLTLGDDLTTLADAISRQMTRTDMTVLVGGLGPTHDDITKDAVAFVLGRPLEYHASVAERIRARYQRSPGREEAIRQQSLLVSGAVVLPNSRGTAPGQRIETEAHTLILLPGPPREMQAVFGDHIRPWLAERTGTTIRRDTWVNYQWGESVVAHYLEGLVRGQHPKVGLYASPGVVEIRLESTADLPRGQSLANVRAEAWMTPRIPGVLFRCEARTPREDRLVAELVHRHWRIATMESLTGGMLTARLVNVPGASGCLAEGAFAYTNEAKVANGVPGRVLEEAGAVSPAAARAMAEAVRRKADVDIGVSTTGFAGPQGGTPHRPVGTYFVAVATAQGTWVRRRLMRSDRMGVRRAATEGAITLLWEVLELPQTY